MYNIIKTLINNLEFLKIFLDSRIVKILSLKIKNSVCLQELKYFENSIPNPIHT